MRRDHHPIRACLILVVLIMAGGLLAVSSPVSPVIHVAAAMAQDKGGIVKPPPTPKPRPSPRASSSSDTSRKGGTRAKPGNGAARSRSQGGTQVAAVAPIVGEWAEKNELGFHAFIFYKNGTVKRILGRYVRLGTWSLSQTGYSDTRVTINFDDYIYANNYEPKCQWSGTMVGNVMSLNYGGCYHPLTLRKFNSK